MSETPGDPEDADRSREAGNGPESGPPAGDDPADQTPNPKTQPKETRTP